MPPLPCGLIDGGGTHEGHIADQSAPIDRSVPSPGDAWRFGRPPSVAAMAAHTRRVSIFNAAASRGEGSAARQVRSGVTAALHDETFRRCSPVLTIHGRA
jgi:hypothetical protein